jgi:integrase
MPQTVTAGEARQLVLACSRGATGARNRALLVLLYRAGLRIGEALALKPEQFDPEHGVLRVVYGKRTRTARRGAKRTHAPRTVAVDPEAAGLIAAWLYTRDQRGIPAEAPLLCTLQGRPVLASYARALVVRLAGRAGIRKRVHPHALRHTFAAELAREGKPVNLIQAALGHRSLATTSTYLAHVAPDELVNALRARPWSPTEPTER